jgi:hypothetical protein
MTCRLERRGKKMRGVRLKLEGNVQDIQHRPHFALLFGFWGTAKGR